MRQFVMPSPCHERAHPNTIPLIARNPLAFVDSGPQSNTLGPVILALCAQAECEVRAPRVILVWKELAIPLLLVS